ncbi:Hsp20/alpha crystallin family protein [bacterium]|nr:MAG: Hsp20/alpha crystallin family protein [bacterium]
MAIVRWRPFGDLADWTDEVERRIRRMFREEPEGDSPMWAPRVDIKETADALEVHAEIPGMKKEDINVSMKEGILSISGEKKTEERDEGDNWHRIERMFGTFRRSFYIPTEVDETKVKAAYKDGVLTITMPKKEEAKRKEIPIQVE